MAHPCTRLSPGQTHAVPAGVAHAAYNAGDGAVRFLIGGRTRERSRATWRSSTKCGRFYALSRASRVAIELDQSRVYEAIVGSTP